MKQDNKKIISYILVIIGFTYLAYLSLTILASNLWQLLIASALIMSGIIIGGRILIP